MRVLLSSIPGVPGPGAASPELARHGEVLEQARAARAQLVLFPGYGLITPAGSSVAPGQVAPAPPSSPPPGSSGALHELLAATGMSRMAAVVGIAAQGAGHPTDGPSAAAFAWGGRILGTRAVGATDGGTAGSWTLGSARLSVVAGTLGARVRAWRSAAGSDLICAWPTGASVGPSGGAAVARALAEARTEAVRAGTWVAVVAAVGDGPAVGAAHGGAAALVDPHGEVVARASGDEAAALVVDVPVAVDVEPVRTSVRVLLVDGDARTLLAEFGDDETGARWWVPPGGGIEPGEDDHAAARRELLEELGRDDLVIGPAIGVRGGTFLAPTPPTSSAAPTGEPSVRWMTQRERWYLSRVDRFEVRAEVVAAARAEGIRALRWWSADELRAAAAITGPPDLADLLEAVVAGHLPDPACDLGF